MLFRSLKRSSWGGREKDFKRGEGEDAPARAHMLLLPIHLVFAATTSAAAFSPPRLRIAAARRPPPASAADYGLLHAPPRATRGRAPSSGRRRLRGAGGLQRRSWPSSGRRGQGDYGLVHCSLLLRGAPAAALWASSALLCSVLCFQLSNY